MKEPLILEGGTHSDHEAASSSSRVHTVCDPGVGHGCLNPFAHRHRQECRHARPRDGYADKQQRCTHRKAGQLLNKGGPSQTYGKLEILELIDAFPMPLRVVIKSSQARTVRAIGLGTRNDVSTWA
jgi:hypothetical protein